MSKMVQAIEQYKKLLLKYIKNRDEHALYEAQEFSRLFLKEHISPEELVGVHNRALQEIYPDLSDEISESLNFLLETMVSYGLAYREHRSLKDKQDELKSELVVAANMQDMLLSSALPDVDSMDIGAKSVPAREMNGDYYHFVQDDEQCIGIAIADIIGKGIPAALCMSMIKYSMDSLPETRMQPGHVLGSLNRVVERNVDPSMFITMFYGIYDARYHKFFYASAGHEPGFHYSSQDDAFYELEARGLVLGVNNHTTYREYHKQIEVGDMIILLTDGVTECRSKGRFIDQEEVIQMVRENMHLPAQEIVDKVFTTLFNFQDFEMKDDFTLIVMKRNV